MNKLLQAGLHRRVIAPRKKSDFHTLKFRLLNNRAWRWVVWGWALLPLAGWANDFTYTTNSPDTNAITITGYFGLETDVEIPATIEGKTVADIGAQSFEDRSAILAS